MNRHVNAITGRLSLRPPQRDSLELLARLADKIPLKKERDLAAVLEAVKAEVPGFTDFERDFPSLCFALATGVGKTRLMGAFISYLHLAWGIRHYFVLAPNLTIYHKLIADFTPNSPKYVFQGIAEFVANPPEIITGDNYESGRATRQDDLFGPIQVNIFNISKINAEVRGGNVPKIKGLKEYIGQSYFDYLAGLEDLVLLMDESHRYRAKAGMRAINELKAVLGLELTATPKIQSGQNAQDFKNVVFRYVLADALKDGFVKEPAVVTRENFDPTPYKERPEELDRIKLEDGVGLHELTKVELEVYARQNNKPVVKPFVLVVARTTEHADQVEKIIKSEAFFGGRYKDKVITVHSNQSGEVEDETLRRLLDVEKTEEHTEIVIHVNKLGEGWDVTNLYTIVPLRAFTAEILTEQTLGRGLRLPYGKRTGVPAVDRLSIVAHDRFEEIVDAANRPDSIIRASFKISAGAGAEHKKIVQIQPVLLQRLGVVAAQENLAMGDTTQVKPLFSTAGERAVAQATIDVIQRSFSRKPVSYLASDPATQAAVLKEVAAAVTPKQGELTAVIEQPRIEEIVKQITALLPDLVIQIPRIVVVPKGDAGGGFRDFDLNVASVTQQPVSDDVLVQVLTTNEQIRVKMELYGDIEARLEDYMVRHLIDKDDIDYDQHADLLYKLAGQLVARLRTYLPDDAAVQNVVKYSQLNYAELIYQQMQAHYFDHATEWEARVSSGFNELRACPVSIGAAEALRDFRAPVDEKQDIRSMHFGGFRKCLYGTQKFDSDSERRFSVVLEQDDSVLKWFKPVNDREIRIHLKDGSTYRPDFVVETKTTKFLCEPKMRKEMDNQDVKDKAQAAVTWCKHATEHCQEGDGKKWRYLLIPHDAITGNMTLDGLASRFALG
jgi:type III restriction enzyme